MCIKSPSVYIQPGSMQASELGPSVQQVLQEGPHILVHFHRIGLGDPVPHAWQDVGFEPAWHKTAADGLYQPFSPHSSSVGVASSWGSRGKVL